MNKLVIIAIVVVIIIVIVLMMSGSDPWVGNWAGKGGPNDRTTIRGGSGKYTFDNTVTGEKLDLTISGVRIWGYGNQGIRNGNTVNWNVDNVWTKVG